MFYFSVTAKLDKTKATVKGTVPFAQDEEIMADLLTDRTGTAIQALGIPDGLESKFLQALPAFCEKF